MSSTMALQCRTIWIRKTFLASVQPTGGECDTIKSCGPIQGSAADNQEMAIPMQRYMMPPLMQQPSQQPLQNPMELLAAMEGWDPMRMYNMTHLPNPLGGEVGPLEGAGRMSQSGGVMGRTMPSRPQQAGRIPGMIMAQCEHQGSVAWRVGRQTNTAPQPGRPSGNGEVAHTVELLIGSHDQIVDLEQQS